MRTYAILCVFAFLTFFGVTKATAQSAANSQARLAEIEQDIKTNNHSGVLYSFTLPTQDVSTLNQLFDKETSILNYYYKVAGSNGSKYIVLTESKTYGATYLTSLLKTAGFKDSQVNLIR